MAARADAVQLATTSSYAGSGAVSCYQSSLSGDLFRAPREYCCPGQTEGSRLTNCYTQSDFDWILGPDYAQKKCDGATHPAQHT